MNSLQYAPGNILERIRGNTHHLTNKLIDAQVVDTFQQFVGSRHITHLNIHRQVYLEAISNHLFQVVAAVGSVKLHPLELNLCPHSFVYYFA